MNSRTSRQVALNGFGWGCVAGLALIALMYLSDLLLGLKTLPQLLNQPLLALLPGFVFGFLIDTLQHAGKVVEEIGLILAMVVALGVLGSVAALAGRRWTSQWVPLGFAAVGWLFVVGLLLPIGGSGFLGLSDGTATPIIWATLFAIYGVILQSASSRPGAVNPGRRRVLSELPIAIAAVSLGLLGLRLIPKWYQAVFLPPEGGLSGISPQLTPVDNFYYVSKNFVDPDVDGQSWGLAVGGLVDRPLQLTLDGVKALPGVVQYVTLECVSNNVGGPQMSTGLFGGIRLADLVAMASPQSRGSWVAFTARDGYTESLPLSLVQGAPEILVAYELDGAPLPMSHGFPARLVIPGHYGMKGPKWLDRIDLVDHESGGFWEQHGWDHNAVVKTTARFDEPHDGDVVKLGQVSIGGVAFAGTRGISQVEFSTDGGSTWTSAPFTSPLSPYTWVVWQSTWTPHSEGAYRLVVRAVEADGTLQSSASAPSFPSGASGYHTIGVDVGQSS